MKFIECTGTLSKKKVLVNAEDISMVFEKGFLFLYPDHREVLGSAMIRTKNGNVVFVKETFAEIKKQLVKDTQEEK